MASTFSQIAGATVGLNNKLGIGGGSARTGPFGQSLPGARGKDFLDKTFKVGDYDPSKVASDQATQQAEQDEANKQTLRDQVNTMFSGPDLKTQEGDLSTALTGNYSDTLKQRYQDAERSLRFGAARTGNIGSTDYADEQARLDRDNQLGGTQISDAVTRAIGNLRASREATRANAIGLINAGQGTEGVNSATSGLTADINTARNASRESLFNDLFQNIAYNRSQQLGGNANLAALLAAAQRGGPTSIFATAPSGGTVIQ